MVAAEFWEQGDLERTVLDQQPIVSPSICSPHRKQIILYIVYSIEYGCLYGHVVNRFY